MKEKKIYTAQHCGSLEEMLETEKPITKETFIKLLEAKLYEFDCYDNRLNCNRYLLKDMHHNYGLPIWINDYSKTKIK